MEIEMLRQDTGEFRARLSYFVKEFLTENATQIDKMVKGEVFQKRKEITIEQEAQYYDMTFIFRKGGLIKKSTLEVIVNGAMTAKILI
ncbi:TPA: hypothetical protein ACGORE_001475 [Streptococcus suis]|jgi:hypothetical protein|uniref:Uncharacterized protein n=2 Tax=Streptococcus TaxID=1301 RepID=A0A3L8GPC4_STRIN|nr:MULTISPECIES: hypothetical protein [Streptococcus]ADX24154.1 hypothetical protein SDE12394_03145 [Streptococcus dysgalactiae subsp. equisimilis ATCC 12394]EGL47891.1 hypothetical protein HMPREF9964_1675 [Streptococcus dysgalactiae subsp. equisimilis SK1249]MDG3146574.1 hypothetical protein [Streptococcus suis]NCB80121.1 hypothetical protein [Bacilli bacterium]KAF1153720.1 hypothetical protein B8V37_06610 [Streptococcus agalactiae]